VLTNFLSFHIFEYINECETYEAAIQKLDSVLMKMLNKVFACHLLATAKQKPGRSFDKLLQELRRLSKDCNFQAITRDQHRNGFLRDAFINSILSTAIRRRLLEVTLTIDTAFEKACALYVAQKNSDGYASTKASASLTAIENTSEIPSTYLVSAVSNCASACFFYGSQVRHNRKKCPERDTIWYKC